jgi:hypothetical protein
MRINEDCSKIDGFIGALLAACADAAPTEPRLAVSTSHNQSEARVDLGPCDGLAVPAGNKLMLRLYAQGVQIYQWNGASWGMFRCAGSEVDRRRRRQRRRRHALSRANVGKQRGSKVVGAVAKRRAPDPTAIACLLLSGRPTEGNGIFDRVTFIQGINTAAGIAPTTPGTFVGEEKRQPIRRNIFSTGLNDSGRVHGDVAPNKVGATLDTNVDCCSQLDAPAPPLVEGTFEAFPLGLRGRVACRAEIRGDRRDVIDRIAVNHNFVAVRAVAQAEPEQAPARENREGGDAAAEAGLLVVDVGVERCGEANTVQGCLVDPDTDVAGERNMVVQVWLELVHKAPGFTVASRLNLPFPGSRGEVDELSNRASENST